MSKMTFTDGVTFDTDGPYRVESRHDGYYVVGRGLLCPVDNYNQGYEMIRELKDLARAREMGEKSVVSQDN